MLVHSAPQQVDSGLKLGDARLRYCRATADSSQFGVHHAVPFARLAGIQTHQTVQQAALLFEGSIERRGRSVRIFVVRTRRRRPSRCAACLPGLPLAIVLASFSPIKGWVLLTVILLFTSWSYGARVLRAQTLSLKEREFVAAARASGEASTRLIFAEILPNEVALVVSNFVTTFVYTILAEVALEFLGLGDISHSSWGVILFWAQSDNALLGGQWWRFVPPGLCVAILCSGLTFINSGIDELANPRLRREKPVQAARSLSASPPATDEQQKEHSTVLKKL